MGSPAANKAWREANRERISAYNKAWNAAHKEQKRALNAKADPAVERARSLAWRNNNLERAREIRRTWYRKNRGAACATSLAYAKAHPEVQRKAAGRRRARTAKAFVADVSLPDLVLGQAGLCYLCSEPLGGRATVEHVVPLSKGGTHEPANCAAAHRSCNARKGTRSLLLYLLASRVVV